MSVMWIHGHEARAKDTLHIADRVNRRHDCVSHASPRPYLHLRLLVELCLDLLFRQAILLTQSPSFTLTHCTGEDCLSLIFGYGGTEGITTTSSALSVEG